MPHTNVATTPAVPRLSARLATLAVALAVTGAGTAEPPSPPVSQQAPVTAESLVRTELLATVDRVEAGTPFDVLVVFHCAPDWHLYWRNPGDSGSPPTVKWQLPQGFTASAVRFPLPSVHDIPGEVTYVHEGEFAVVATITPPAEAAAMPASVAIRADIAWMTCKEICLLGRRSHALALPAGPTSSLGASDSSTDRVARLLAAFPKPAGALGISSQITGSALEITLPAGSPSSAIFVPDHTPGVEYGTPVLGGPSQAPILRVPLTLRAQDALGGVLRAAGVVILDPAKRPPVGAEIDIRLPSGDSTQPTPPKASEP